MTKKELSQKTGYSRPTIDKWLAQGETEETILAKPKQSVRYDGRKTGTPQSKAEWEIRKEKALALTREIELEQLKGSLIDVDVVNAWISNNIVRAREVLLRIAPELKDKLAQETDPVLIEMMLDTEVRRALNELSKAKPE